MRNANLPELGTPETHKPDLGGWLQVEKKTLRAITQLTVKHPVAAGMLHLLASKMSRTNAVVLSHKAIAEELGVVERSVKRALVILREGNWVEVLKVGTTNAYRINSRVYWQGERGKRFASFYAAVSVREDEQDPGVVDNHEPLHQIPVAAPDERVLVGNEPLDPPDQQELFLA